MRLAVLWRVVAMGSALLVTGAAFAAGLSANDEVIAQAKRLAAELKARGHLNAPVEILPGKIENSPGTANWDFRQGTCRVKLDPQQIETSSYRSAEAFRFFIYHELSHCEYFARPGGAFSFPELTAAEQQLMDELLLLDWLEELDRLDMMSHWHEVYADVRAVLLLLEEGVDPRRLLPLAQLREEAWADQLHDSAELLRAALSLSVMELRNAGLESKARALTAGYVLRRQFARHFLNTESLPLDIVHLFGSRIKALHFQLIRDGKIHASPALAGIEHAPSERLAAYPTLQWLYTEGLREARHISEAEFLRRWQERVVGAEFEALAQRASAKLMPYMAAAYAQRP